MNVAPAFITTPDWNKKFVSGRSHLGCVVFQSTRRCAFFHLYGHIHLFSPFFQADSCRDLSQVSVPISACLLSLIDFIFVPVPFISSLFRQAIDSIAEISPHSIWSQHSFVISSPHQGDEIARISEPSDSMFLESGSTRFEHGERLQPQSQPECYPTREAIGSWLGHSGLSKQTGGSLRQRQKKSTLRGKGENAAVLVANGLCWVWQYELVGRITQTSRVWLLSLEDGQQYGLHGAVVD